MSTQLPKSKRGATRQWNALLRKYKRDFMGGGLFGFDWRTMKINSPEVFERLETLRELFSEASGLSGG